AGSWSRSGPTVPFDPAGPNVWQLEHPAATKMSLPDVAAIFPPPAGAAVGFPATDATYAATASASLPVTGLRGMQRLGFPGSTQAEGLEPSSCSTASTRVG